jgi:hypothetical protein
MPHSTQAGVSYAGHEDHSAPADAVPDWRPAPAPDVEQPAEAEGKTTAKDKTARRPRTTTRKGA